MERRLVRTSRAWQRHRCMLACAPPRLLADQPWRRAPRSRVLQASSTGRVADGAHARWQHPAGLIGGLASMPLHAAPNSPASGVHHRGARARPAIATEATALLAEFRVQHESIAEPAEGGELDLMHRCNVSDMHATRRWGSACSVLQAFRQPRAIQGRSRLRGATFSPLSPSTRLLPHCGTQTGGPHGTSRADDGRGTAAHRQANRGVRYRGPGARGRERRRHCSMTAARRSRLRRANDSSSAVAAQEVIWGGAPLWDARMHEVVWRAPGSRGSAAAHPETVRRARFDGCGGDRRLLGEHPSMQRGKEGVGEDEEDEEQAGEPDAAALSRASRVSSSCLITTLTFCQSAVRGTCG